MLKFYIASGYENKENVSNLAEILSRCGFEFTLDWTRLPHTVGDLNTIARLEIDGIRKSDVVIVLMPGALGTHTELGAALSLDKQIIIIGDREIFKSDPAVPFYYDDKVSFIQANGAVSVGMLIEKLGCIQFDMEVQNAQKN